MNYEEIAQNLREMSVKAVQSVEQAVARGKELLAQEQEKAASLLTSPEWSSWSEQECAQAVIAHNKRLNQAKRNLIEAEKAYKRLKKRAKEINL